MTEETTKDNVRFGIESKNEAEGTIVVVYWVDGQNFTFRSNIQLPIDPVTSAIPTGQELKDMILGHAPVSWFDEQLKRFKASVFVDYSEIDRLIEEGKTTIPQVL